MFQYNPLHSGDFIPREHTERVLEIQPAYTQNVAGKLTICKRMPVLLKRNDATELNVTNGAEANVRSWRSSTLPDGRKVLDVLFVELKNPPSPVKLEGLPMNVVPICRVKQSIIIEFPNGKKVGVNRDQIPLLSNFVMSHYAAQGRTRPVNIMDLEHAVGHQAVYTCLSRASAFKGTVILRMCSHGSITGGLKQDGRLRQEFRELELLNEITRLRWEGLLDKGVGGNTRSTLLKSYLKMYGTKKCPEHVHPAVRWSHEGDTTLVVDYNDDPTFVWRKAGEQGANANKEKSGQGNRWR